MRTALIAVIAIALAACQTPYVETKPGGYGLQVIRLNADTYRVQASGNRHSSMDLMREYVLLKAAELGRVRGAERFIEVGLSEDIHRQRYITLPRMACASSREVLSCGVSPGGFVTLERPTMTMNVRFLDAGEPAPSREYSVDLLYEQLGPKYILGFQRGAG